MKKKTSFYNELAWGLMHSPVNTNWDENDNTIGFTITDVPHYVEIVSADEKKASIRIDGGQIRRYPVVKGLDGAQDAIALDIYKRLALNDIRLCLYREMAKIINPKFIIDQTDTGIYIYTKPAGYDAPRVSIDIHQKRVHNADYQRYEITIKSYLDPWSDTVDVESINIFMDITGEHNVKGICALAFQSYFI